ncbi:unnamed protein product, partial [Effrenium voratum]
CYRSFCFLCSPRRAARRARRHELEAELQGSPGGGQRGVPGGELHLPPGDGVISHGDANEIEGHQEGRERRHVTDLQVLQQHLPTAAARRPHWQMGPAAGGVPATRGLHGAVHHGQHHGQPGHGSALRAGVGEAEGRDTGEEGHVSLSALQFRFWVCRT